MKTTRAIPVIRRMRFLRYHVGKIAVTSANATRRGASVFTRTDKRLCSLRLKFEAPAVLARWGGPDEGGQRGPGGGPASAASEVVVVRLR